MTIKALNSCKMVPGSSVSAHVLNMKGYIDTLEKLGPPISRELATDLILTSLPSEYDQFVMNFNMHGMEKTLAELHGMLKNAEQNIKKTKQRVQKESLNPSLRIRLDLILKARLLTQAKRKKLGLLNPKLKRKECVVSVMKLFIVRGITHSTWKGSRRIEARLPLQVSFL